MTQATAFVITHESDRTRTQADKSMSIIALTLTRALGRAGVKVIRVHPNRLEHSLVSKYCSGVEVCPDMYESEEALNAFLKALSGKYTGKRILIPASDDCSMYVARQEAALCADYTLLNPSAGAMERMKNKRLQYELAQAADVPIPETYFPQTEQDIQDVVSKAQNYPYVIKPLEAQKWRLDEFKDIAQGQKAIKVHSKEDLLREFRRIAPFDNQLMVQEIITGEDTNLYTFLAYCDSTAKPLAYCIRSKLRQSPIKFGYCCATISCHNDTVEQQAKRMLSEAGYTGIVGIEFKLDPKTNTYKLIEINTRPVNTTGISIGCGVNLPLIAFKDAAGEKQTPVTDWEDDVTWVWLYHDFWVVKEMKALGLITYKEWFQSIRGRRVHAIFAWDDIAPVWAFYSKSLGALFSAKFKRFMSKGGQKAVA